MKIFVQAWCWLLMAGVVGIGAIYAWMMAEMSRVTLEQVMETVRFTAVFGLGWPLYQRLTRRPQDHPAGKSPLAG